LLQRSRWGRLGRHSTGHGSHGGFLDERAGFFVGPKEELDLRPHHCIITALRGNERCPLHRWAFEG
jgi:hypothetical protein